MEQRLEKDHYQTPEDFIRDAGLIFKNCKKYNNETTTYYKNAVKLEKFLNTKLREIPEWSVSFVYPIWSVMWLYLWGEGAGRMLIVHDIIAFGELISCVSTTDSFSLCHFCPFLRKNKKKQMYLRFLFYFAFSILPLRYISYLISTSSTFPLPHPWNPTPPPLSLSQIESLTTTPHQLYTLLILIWNVASVQLFLAEGADWLII